MKRDCAAPFFVWLLVKRLTRRPRHRNRVVRPAKPGFNSSPGLLPGQYQLMGSRTGATLGYNSYMGVDWRTIPNLPQPAPQHGCSLVAPSLRDRCVRNSLLSLPILWAQPKHLHHTCECPSRRMRASAALSSTVTGACFQPAKHTKLGIKSFQAIKLLGFNH